MNLGIIKVSKQNGIVADLLAIDNIFGTDVIDGIIYDDKARTSGNIFLWRTSSLAVNNGTVYQGKSSGFWEMQYNSHINVKWFGATGDGSTDDYVNIQAAIDYAASNSVAHFGEVFFPAGIYMITVGLILKNGTSLKGEYSTLPSGTDQSPLLEKLSIIKASQIMEAMVKNEINNKYPQTGEESGALKSLMSSGLFNLYLHGNGLANYGMYCYEAWGGTLVGCRIDHTVSYGFNSFDCNVHILRDNCIKRVLLDSTADSTFEGNTLISSANLPAVAASRSIVNVVSDNLIYSASDVDDSATLSITNIAKNGTITFVPNSLILDSTRWEASPTSSPSGVVASFNGSSVTLAVTSTDNTFPAVIPNLSPLTTGRQYKISMNTALNSTGLQAIRTFNLSSGNVSQVYDSNVKVLSNETSPYNGTPFTYTPVTSTSPLKITVNAIVYKATADNSITFFNDPDHAINTITVNNSPSLGFDKYGFEIGDQLVITGTTFNNKTVYVTGIVGSYTLQTSTTLANEPSTVAAVITLIKNNSYKSTFKVNITSTLLKIEDSSNQFITPWNFNSGVEIIITGLPDVILNGVKYTNNGIYTIASGSTAGMLLINGTFTPQTVNTITADTIVNLTAKSKASLIEFTAIKLLPNNATTGGIPARKDPYIFKYISDTLPTSFLGSITYYANTISFTAGGASPSTIVNTTNAFGVKGFLSGQTIKVSGSAGNSGNYTITAISSDQKTLTVLEPISANENAGPNITITIEGPRSFAGTPIFSADKTIRDYTMKFISGGFHKGQSISITGSSNNKGIFTIVDVIRDSSNTYDQITVLESLIAETPSSTITFTISTISLGRSYYLNFLGFDTLQIAATRANLKNNIYLTFPSAFSNSGLVLGSPEGLISLVGSDNSGSVSGNVFSGNKIEDIVTTGIFMRAAYDNIFTGNTIFKGDVGNDITLIKLLAGSFDNSFVGNIINKRLFNTVDKTLKNIVIDSYSGRNIFSGNKIANATSYDIYCMYDGITENTNKFDDISLANALTFIKKPSDYFPQATGIRIPVNNVGCMQTINRVIESTDIEYVLYFKDVVFYDLKTSYIFTQSNSTAGSIIITKTEYVPAAGATAEIVSVIDVAINGNVSSIRSSKAILINTSYSISVVRLADGTIKVYIDGILDGSGTAQNNPATPNVSTFIGGYTGGQTGDMSIAEFRYYADSMSDEEIATLSTGTRLDLLKWRSSNIAVDGNFTASIQTTFAPTAGATHLSVGGIDGGNCVSVTLSSSTTSLTVNGNINRNDFYRISFYARIDTTVSGNDIQSLQIGRDSNAIKVIQTLTGSYAKYVAYMPQAWQNLGTVFTQNIQLRAVKEVDTALTSDYINASNGTYFLSRFRIDKNGPPLRVLYDFTRGDGTKFYNQNPDAATINPIMNIGLAAYSTDLNGLPTNSLFNSAVSIKLIASAYTIQTTDLIIGCMVSSGGVTITLPTTGLIVGKQFVIRDESGAVNSSTNIITIVGIIDSVTNKTITTPFGSVRAFWNGNNYSSF